MLEGTGLLGTGLPTTTADDDLREVGEEVAPTEDGAPVLTGAPVMTGALLDEAALVEEDETLIEEDEALVEEDETLDGLDCTGATVAFPSPGRGGVHAGGAFEGR